MRIRKGDSSTNGSIIMPNICLSTMRQGHARVRENRSVASVTAMRNCGFVRKKADGTAGAKIIRRQMSLDLFLILAALLMAGIFLGLIQTARATEVLISSKAVPEPATYYRMQGVGPLPFNPFPDLPLYAVDWSTNIFIIDDRKVDYEELYKERMAQAETEGEQEDFGPSGPAYDYGTNGLWIELYAHDRTNALAYMTLHNTRSNYYYQLLSRTEVNAPEWKLGQIIRDVYGTNQVYFDPVPSVPQPMRFFRGVEGTTVVSISRFTDATEPHGSIVPGDYGRFDVSRSPAAASSLTVVYGISGTASNGGDYMTLGNTATIPANSSGTSFLIGPYEDNLLEFDETIRLSLVPPTATW